MQFLNKLQFFAYIVVFNLIIRKSLARTLVKRSSQLLCSKVSKRDLSELMGPHYNQRYMSILAPPSKEDSEKAKFKRKTERYPSFYVDEDFSQQLSDEPAWNYQHLSDSVNYTDTNPEPRYKRATQIAQEWHCESRLTWMDLGPDYFPQYLRTVECTSRSCWYGRYKCRPRSFGIKLLRRKKDRCVVTEIGSKIGQEGLPVELRELWVWEERAVNFCCECAL